MACQLRIWPQVNGVPGVRQRIHQGAPARKELHMRTSTSQDQAFLSAVISSTLLEESLEWIRQNLSPDEVFEEDTLKEWAVNNGMVEE